MCNGVVLVGVGVELCCSSLVFAGVVCSGGSGPAHLWPWGGASHELLLPLLLQVLPQKVSLTLPSHVH